MGNAHDATQVNLVNAFSKLVEMGIEFVTYTYSGSGDSGCISDVEIVPPSSANADDWASAFKIMFYVGFCEEVDERESSFENALRGIADELLESAHGGWENGDGGFGTVMFDVANQNVLIEHSDYIVEIEARPTIAIGVNGKVPQ